ncbi:MULTISPECIES: DUF4177 domain-containing protein [Rhodobacterales]|uniref:DUF4177 domain-containing protein n=1 Tax=Rhodobacterales TaxID=204455 RepID=UPI0015F10BF6|nr:MULTISPECIES: DUF4177 domain-containing protein [Rhodobacterales]MDO6589067.1 DUF4177 domain-containing protein [Yoonia sp. 1_MG-2023]
MSYEYMVVPAPTRGIKAKGARTAEERFAIALETKMNKMSNDGWDYMRTDTLPAEQREGLMGKTTVYQNMLVFRRAKKAQRPATPAAAPVVAAPTPPKPAPKVEPVKEVAPVKPVSDDAGDADA